MNQLKLQMLYARVSERYLEENDVHVTFDYDKQSEREAQFFLTSYIGKDDKNYRFLLKMIYEIKFSHDLQDDDEMIEEAIQIILDPLMNFIITIDDVIRPEKERFS